MDHEVEQLPRLSLEFKGLNARSHLFSSCDTGSYAGRSRFIFQNPAQ
jgi:hypothetical protein